MPLLHIAGYIFLSLISVGFSFGRRRVWEQPQRGEAA
jgi:hypothetical protein